MGARKGIRGETFGWSCQEKNFGSQNCVIPDLNTCEFSAFFEISRKLTSASEPALYTSPVGARKGIRGETFGWSFHEKNFGSQNCVIPDLNT